MKWFKKKSAAQPGVPAAPSQGARRKRSGAPVALVILLVLSTVFFSLLVGVGGGIFAVAALLPVALFFVMAMTGSFSSFHFGGEGAFWAIFLSVVGTAFLDTISPVHTRGLVTVILMLLSFMAARGLRVFIGESSMGKAMVLLIGVFFITGLAGAIHSHPHLRATLYQAAYNLKLPLMIGLGFAVTLGDRSLRRFWRVQQAVLFISVLGCLFQLASPHLYHMVARGGANLGGANPLIPFLPLMAGPFSHPGVMAFTASLFFCLFVVRQLCGDGNRWENYFTMAGFLGIMLISGERQETFDGLIAALILVFISRVRYSIRAMVAVSLLVVVAAATLLAALGEDRVTRMAAEHGLAPSTHALEMPRAIMYNDAFYLARREFPLGTGFGTYGGDASKNFDRSVYESLGYHRYWWYRADLYLLDTYWPNLFAESGFLGGGAVLLFAMMMLGYALYQAWRVTDPGARLWWRMALVGQLLAFGSALTGPSYGDPSTVGVPFLFFGMAYMRARQLRLAQGAAAPAPSNGTVAAVPMRFA
ncbi:hypothetical protein [Duganella violaceipulchra]|uniref:O-antigen ligase domain-containing protein n=1 Tax=Duganella violaceipulchra TaxID=2849652 RepID=A0AA41L3N2_9BURK|nr:hypothetical protein [Duganella violaceicalia]MBV6319947.1 hypothetical protein [Duganella violaceicalia]MCP2010311.1 hypothetical protein [Duganella violaceicalia]